MDDINDKEGGLLEFSNGYKRFGINRNKADTGLLLREWLPAAKAVHLFGPSPIAAVTLLSLTQLSPGDFNDWNRTSHACIKDDFGVWSLELLDSNDAEAIATGSRVKVHPFVLSDQLQLRPCCI